MCDEQKTIQEDNLTRYPNLKKMFSAKEIKNMSAHQRKQLNDTYTGDTQTTQQRQMEDYFRTKPETSNAVRLPTIITKRPRLTQLTLVNTFGTPMTCQKKTKKTKKRKGIQCQLLEEWSTPTGKRQIRRRNKLHRNKLNGTPTQRNDKQEADTNRQTETDPEELIQTQNDKWFVLGEEMSITEVAKKMGARPEEYLTYVRQFHPFGNQEKYEVTKTEDTLKRNTALPWIFRRSQNITHDTNSNGEPSLGVGIIPDIIKQVMEHNNLNQIQVLGDGQCVRRALAKNMEMQPGTLIELISRTCTALMSLTMTKVEQRTSAYAIEIAKIINYPTIMEQYMNMEENVTLRCNRNNWGGSFEARMTAHITDIPVMIIDIAEMHISIQWPALSVGTTVTIIDNADMINRTIEILEDTYDDWVMTLYQGDHFNAVIKTQAKQRDDYRNPIQLIHHRIYTTTPQIISEGEERDSTTNKRLR